MNIAAMPGELNAAADVDRLAHLLVSPKTGILKRVFLSPRFGDEAPILCPGAELSRYSTMPCMADVAVPGGSGFDLSECMARLLFEAVERYCAAYVDRDRMLWARASSESFLCGPRFPLYADFQYAQQEWPFQPWSAQSEIWWVQGSSLFTGECRFVPASFVHVPYKATSAMEWMGPSVSTGMAAAPSWQKACLSGLLEVCERDAFCIMWMNSLSMPRLKLHPSSRLRKNVDGFLEATGSKLTFINITNDLGVPTAAAVLQCFYRGEPIITVGSSAKPSLEQACEKAFAEAANGYIRVIHDIEQRGEKWRPAPDFSDVTDWEWHALMYANPEFLDFLGFMTASSEEQEVEPACGGHCDDGEALKNYLSRFKEKFGDIVAIDLTTREFVELGMSVVKILVPDAVPLHPDHRYPWLGHQRLYTVPRMMGYSTNNTKVQDLNKNPHPFA